MTNDLTKRFIDKVVRENVSLRALEKELNIPYDRMFKWKQGKANPKPPDTDIIEDWINGTTSKKSKKVFISFDAGSSIKKTEIMVEVILSAVAELVAEKHGHSPSVVREQFQAVVNARLSNGEPEQSMNGE